MKINAEYIWVDSDNEFRSKVKTIEYNSNINIDLFPLWNYDGSSTNQAQVGDSEIMLKPYSFYKYSENYYLVFCENYKNDVYFTNRKNAFEKFDEYKVKEPMFGLEQEFYVIDNETNLPVGFYKKEGYLSDTLFIKNEGKNYCGVGTINYKLRQFMDKVMSKLIELNISVTGMNMEVVPGQCEFQICNTGIKACDELMVLRYLLCRISEEFNYKISFENKPYSNYSGSGCHINFSTKEMREENGIEFINKMLDKLKDNNPIEHIHHYGKNNYLRLTGRNETSKYDEFSFGVGSRTSSIRIPNCVVTDGCGYLEDRRPGANIDPYKACLYLFKFSL